jgi:hypothetical protein
MVLVLALSACQGSLATSADPSELSDPTLKPTGLPSPDPTATPSPQASEPMDPNDPAPVDAIVGELVVRFETSGLSRGYPGTLVADGRLTIPTASGYVQQRMTPVGVSVVTERMLQSGLFDKDTALAQPLYPDHDPICGEGLGQYAYHSIELWQDGAPTTLTWFTYLLSEFHCYEPSPRVDAANQLLHDLSAAARWLPPDVWADRVLRTYSPAWYRLSTVAQPWPSDAAPAPLVDDVDWPLADTLLSFGERHDIRPYAPHVSRCAVIGNDDADAVTDALTSAGAQFNTPGNPKIMRGTYLHEDSRREMIVVILEPMRPEEDTCDPSPLRDGICWMMGGIDVFGCPIH